MGAWVFHTLGKKMIICSFSSRDIIPVSNTTQVENSLDSFFCGFQREFCLFGTGDSEYECMGVPTVGERKQLSFVHSLRCISLLLPTLSRLKILWIVFVVLKVDYGYLEQGTMNMSAGVFPQWGKENNHLFTL